ncbi:MAG TPA: permease prefix domain 2-containing transporter, partial [Emticicia sp.]
MKKQIPSIPQPPRWAEKLLSAVLPYDLFEELQGDMHEQFDIQVEEIGETKAKWLYVWEALKFCRPYFLKRRFSANPDSINAWYFLINPYMISNYLKIAWRNLLKNKTFGFINLFGLVTGLTTCLLIFLYVNDEMSYDRYNKKADRIYRIDNEIKFSGNYFDLAVCPPLMGQVFQAAFPEIENYTRVRWKGTVLLKKDGQSRPVDRVAYADSTLFNIFDFKFLAGNPATALNEPNAIVLNETQAMKFFNTTNIVGQSFVTDQKTYKITGVFEDMPKQSHFNFDVFVPMADDESSKLTSWLSENFNTYVLLRKDANLAVLQSKMFKLNHEKLSLELKAAVNQTLEEVLKSGGAANISLMPLTDIHLKSNKIGELNGN